MTCDDDSCFRSILRMYCYLRHHGMEPQPACRQLQMLMPEILAANGNINPVLIIRRAVGDGHPGAVSVPRPAPAPALLRGHIGYPSPAG